jgi:hypothetical protein
MFYSVSHKVSLVALDKLPPKKFLGQKAQRESKESAMRKMQLVRVDRGLRIWIAYGALSWSSTFVAQYPAKRNLPASHGTDVPCAGA